MLDITAQTWRRSVVWHPRNIKIRFEKEILSLEARKYQWYEHTTLGFVWLLALFLLIFIRHDVVNANERKTAKITLWHPRLSFVFKILKQKFDCKFVTGIIYRYSIGQKWKVSSPFFVEWINSAKIVLLEMVVRTMVWTWQPCFRFLPNKLLSRMSLIRCYHPRIYKIKSLVSCYHFRIYQINCYWACHW